MVGPVDGMAHVMPPSLLHCIYCVNRVRYWMHYSMETESYSKLLRMVSDDTSQGQAVGTCSG